MSGNAIKLLDGQITLRQRPNMGTQTWTAEFRLPGKKGRIKKATGTRDLDKAKQIALDSFYDFVALDRQGLSPAPRNFGAATKEYLARLKAEVNLGSRTQRAYDDFEAVANRYYVPYFGKMAIDRISESDLTSYLSWRKTYWTTGPGSAEEFRIFQSRGKTVKMRRNRKEASLRSGELRGIKQIFKFAASKGWVEATKIPDFPVTATRKKARGHARPAFTPEEWQHVVENMARYAQAATHPEVRYDRDMLIYYMLIMAHTGMRPTDEHTLVKWRHVEQIERDGAKYCRIWIGEEGKTGSRRIICRNDVYKWLEKIKSLSPWTSLDDYVFANRKTGKPILSFLKGMKSFLSSVGLAANKEGKAFCPYSLRHTYATHRLIDGVDPWIIAKNMGHKSLQMLLDHYGQDDPEYRAKELTETQEDKWREAIIRLKLGVTEQEMCDTADIEQWLTVPARSL